MHMVLPAESNFLKVIDCFGSLYRQMFLCASFIIINCTGKESWGDFARAKKVGVILQGSEQFVVHGFLQFNFGIEDRLVITSRPGLFYSSSVLVINFDGLQKHPESDSIVSKKSPSFQLGCVEARCYKAGIQTDGYYWSSVGRAWLAKMKRKASFRVLLEVELCVVKLPGREAMSAGKVKDAGKVKAVPDWLNSSVWSSRPSNSSLSRKYNDDVTAQANAGAVSVSEGTLQGNVDAESGICTEAATPSGLGAQKPALVREDSKGHEESIQNESEGNDEGIRETVAIWHESSGQKVDNEASNQIEDPLANSWTPPDLDLPSIPGHSSPPRFSSLSFKRSLSVDVRQGQFYSELSKRVINLAELQRLASQGIPDCRGLRPIIWKLLLGYLPRNRALWESELAKKRSEYAVFKEELLVNPSEVTRRMEEASGQEKHGSSDDEGGLLRRFEITHGEHPLSLGKASVWHKFFQDTEITEQIERDVKRTHPDMHFFSGDSASSLSNQEALKHILLIFAKLNPGIRYVQGMNEVLAPLFYVFKTDPDKENAANAEADTFFCFVELLSDFRDHFCQQLDNSVVGIRSTLANLTTLLKKHDEELWRHLEVTTKVNPQFYAFRWITLLLTQEFSFPDCLRIWDSLLSNSDGPLEILLRICCAMLMCVRSRLMAGDFTTNLKLLQHYPFVDTNHLLHVADELRTRSVD